MSKRRKCQESNDLNDKKKRICKCKGQIVYGSFVTQHQIQMSLLVNDFISTNKYIICVKSIQTYKNTFSGFKQREKSYFIALFRTYISKCWCDTGKATPLIILWTYKKTFWIWIQYSLLYIVLLMATVYLHLFMNPVNEIGDIAIDSWSVLHCTSNPPASVPCQPPYISLLDHQRAAAVSLQQTGVVFIWTLRKKNLRWKVTQPDMNQLLLKVCRHRSIMVSVSAPSNTERWLQVSLL